jgi:hypothetical protein
MTPAEFKVFYPEFVSESDTRIQLYLDEAVNMMDMCRWGVWYEKGLGLYTAHQLAIANYNASVASGSAGGAAVSGANDWTSKSVGDVSVSRDASIAAKQVSDPWLRTTYGQQWVYYRNLAGIGAVAV